MKYWIAGLTAVVGSFIVTPAAQASAGGQVCGYTVSSVFGVNCPVRVGQTTCFSIIAAIGPCDAPIDCFGGPGFFCRAHMIPTSGPRAQCPASSIRPRGFKCFAPRLFVPTRTPTPPPVDTDTPTFTATGTPEEPTATATSGDATPTDTATAPVVTPTDTPTLSVATATGTPTGTAEATATVTDTPTEIVATATATSEATVTGTPTGTAAASLVLRF